jgi:hypothetical protein
MRNQTEPQNPSPIPPSTAPSPALRPPAGDGVDPNALVERYVAVWMEPDPAARRARLRDVWAPDGAQILEPPEAMRDASRALGFPHPALEVRGHDALEFRVARAHAEFIAGGRFVFRRHGDAVRVGDVVKFRWEMRSVADGGVAAVGLDLLVLAGDGRIRVDYQFIER